MKTAKWQLLYLPVGHSSTHAAEDLSRKVPTGHWHSLTHIRAQKEGGSSPHTAGQGVPQRTNTWPVISHSTQSIIAFTLMRHVVVCYYIHGLF